MASRFSSSDADTIEGGYIDCFTCLLQGADTWSQQRQHGQKPKDRPRAEGCHLVRLRLHLKYDLVDEVFPLHSVLFVRGRGSGNSFINRARESNKILPHSRIIPNSRERLRPPSHTVVDSSRSPCSETIHGDVSCSMSCAQPFEASPARGSASCILEARNLSLSRICN